MVSVEVPEPVEMFELLIVALGPDGETDVLSVTVPANPLLGIIVIVAVSDLPG